MSTGSGEEAYKQFLSDGHNEDVLKRTYEQVVQILTRDEKINYIATEKRPLINLTPDSIVVTNKRLILYQPTILKVSFEDFIWREVREVTLTEGILGSTLTFQIIGGGKIVADYIPAIQARKVYAYAQEMEEQMIEDRRNRQLEEKRASAGGVHVTQSPRDDKATEKVDALQNLHKLKEMADAGLITVAEYDVKKAEILSRM